MISCREHRSSIRWMYGWWFVQVRLAIVFYWNYTKYIYLSIFSFHDIIVFIFASLVEYATANYYYHKPDRITARNKPAKESTIEMVNETTSNTTSKSPVNRSWTKVLKVIAPPFKSIVPRRTALEIDRKSRFIFPITFILFNVLYWTILLCYSYNSNDQIDWFIKCKL